MTRRWLSIVSLLAAFVLVIAACGDDDTSDTTAAETTTTTAGTTTTAAPTTTEAPDEGPAFDVGVTPAPCDDAVNEGNGCIYLGAITDLSGPFGALGGPLTNAQIDFWGAVNEGGGLDGFDVVILAEDVIDAGYGGQATVEGAAELAERVLGLAQSLGTPQTQAALAAVYAPAQMVAAPATWWSGWAFGDADQNLIMEAGASYCLEAMNGMEFMFGLDQQRDVFPDDFSWAIVYFPGDYGDDYRGGAQIAASLLGWPAGTEIEAVPQSVGGEAAVAAAAAAVIGQGFDLILFVTGPNEWLGVAGGLAQAGEFPLLMGAGPTWNVAFKGALGPGGPAEALAPYVTQAYFNTAPWGGWDVDSDGHAAMRAAAEANARGPHNSYVAGWVFQYTWKTLLEQAIANGDLTRAGVAATAATLDGIDFMGMLPTGSYAGAPNDFVPRSTWIGQPDLEASDGITPVVPAFEGQLAGSFPLDAPCFVTG